MKARIVLISVVCALLACVSSLQATVIIETVPVGNLGNIGELSGAGAGGYGPDRICGAVSYEYNIGKYKVTAGQYAEFLNAVAATDTYGLYNTSMDSHPHGCQITRNGSSGSYTYDFSGRPSGTEANWVDRPVNYVNWGDAARFANWLHNGQPGLVSPVSQDANSTEDGAYFLDGAMGDAALLAVNREANWKWAIPTEDEWYKAAYYDPTDYDPDGPGGTDPGPGYWDYPTSSDSVPSNDLDGGGNNATFEDSGYTIGSPYYRTEFGAHENSESPYGTFDQAGNVFEWNETIILADVEPPSTNRGTRGSAFDYNVTTEMHAAGRSSLIPTYEHDSFGFRVAQIPEPATLGLLLIGGLVLLRRRR